MSTNTLLTPSIIAKSALVLLKNSLIMGQKVSRTYQNEFVKVGDTISVRRPIEYVVTDGATLTEQDTTEGKFTLSVDKRKHVGMSFTTQDLTLTIEEFSSRYIKPAVAQLAHQVDSDLCGLYSKVWNWAGTAGQTVNSFADFAKGPEKLDMLGVPQGNRFGILSPADYWAMVGSQTALYINGAANSAYRNGDLGDIGGVMTGMSQQVATHTVGAGSTGTPLTRGSSNTTTYLASKDTNTMVLSTDGWSTGVTLKAGDVFTINDVYAVNPRTKQSTGQLQQFVVVSDVVTNANASNETQVTISPAIITSGAYQNVDSAPGNDKTITYAGTSATGYKQNMIFHKDAFQLVTVPLEVDPSMGFSARASDPDTGLSIRIAKDYDITNDKIVSRLDILYGVKALRPDLATRLSGTS